MDPRALAIRCDLISYLPRADEETLDAAAREWVRWIGRNISPDDANPGLRADFLQRFGGGDHDDHYEFAQVR